MEYRSGKFLLSTRRMLLLADETPLALEPQVFALLRLLIENHDRVVTRDEIFEVIWKGRSVSDAALSSRIKVARAVLGDDGSRQEMIRTVHGKGFHFVGPVTNETEPQTEQSASHEGPVARPSVAIMPIEMFAPDSSQQAFGTGLMDDIAVGLGRIQSLHSVVSRDGGEPRRVAMELGVRYLLSMRLRFSGSDYRLNASLLDARRMEEVWADQFTGEVTDRFLAQDQVTAAVLGVLVPNIVMLEARRAAGQDSAAADDAYHHVLRAIPLCWSTAEEDNAVALSHIGKAIALSHNYGLAHALASWCRAQEIVYLWSNDPQASRAAVVEHAHHALRASPSDSLVLTFVAHAKSLARDQVAAEHHLKTALAIDPNSAWAWSRLGFVNVFVGRLDEANAAFDRSLELSPLDPMRHSVYFGFGASHFFAGDFESSLRWFEQALIENPDMIWAHRAVAASCAEIGDLDRAMRSVEIVKAHFPAATPESMAEAVPVTLPAYREKLASAYRKAGF